MTLLVITVIIFLATAAIIMVVMAPRQAAPVERIAAFAPPSDRRLSPGAAVDMLTLNERVIGPVKARLVRLAASTAPANIRATTASNLIMAGSPMDPTTFLAIRGAIMIGLPVLAGLYILSLPKVETAHWGLLGIMVIWSRRLPTMWLKRRIKARQKAIDRRLPYALDLMVACLEGGLSLEGALQKVAEQSEGPLVIELRKALQEMVLGRPPSDALRAMGERTGAPDLKRLVENIVQSDRMGVSIADSLRTLARESRVRRRQAAEEMARKAPIKMVPVLIFFILPALAAVIMTPAAILFMRTLEKAGL